MFCFCETFPLFSTFRNISIPIPDLVIGEHASVGEEGDEPAGREQVCLHPARLEVLEQVRQVPHQQPVKLEKSVTKTNKWGKYVL